MKPMLGSRNRLIRRLGTHANMTGLFHFGGAVQRQTVRSGEPGIGTAANLAGLPLAKAFLPRQESAGEAAVAPPADIVAAPEAERAALPGREPELTSSATVYASPELPLAASKPGAARAQTPAPVPSGNVFRAPEPDPIRSAATFAEEKTQPPEDDRAWNRLQNIFNKHKAKHASEEAASLSQSQEIKSSPPDTSAPATEETRQASVSPTKEPPELNNSGRPSIQMKRETVSSPSVQHTDAASSKMNTESAVSPVDSEPGNPAGSQDASSEAPASPPEGTGTAFERPDAIDLPSSIQRKEAPPAKPPAAIPNNETGGLAQSGQPDTPLSRPLMEAPETPTTSLQSLPLEAVWAVETVRQPRSHVPPSPDVSQKVVSNQEEIDQPPESADVDQTSVQRMAFQDDIVKSALQDVHPAQATESGIEFLPPRRPRPGPAPAGSNALTSENVNPPVEIPRGPVQRQAHPGPMHESVEPGVVPTEIGPLPEDLWSLAGAATPPKATPPVTNGAPPERLADGPFSNRENKVPATSAPPPASHISQASQAPVVQRQAASGTTATPASVPPAAGKDSVAEPAGEEVNIEELARQVYSELKHRLGLEWERLRRR